MKNQIGDQFQNVLQCSHIDVETKQLINNYYITVNQCVIKFRKHLRMKISIK